MKRRSPQFEELLTPDQVARAFAVDSKTVTRWQKAGRFPPGTVVMTLGGHRRFKGAVIRQLLKDGER